jgi:signal transduction histidine kinase
MFFRSSTTAKTSLGALATLILTLVAGMASGQNKIDSLEQVLATEKNDSVRLELLIQLSAQAEFSDYRRARSYSDQAMEVARRINNTWAQSKMLFRLATLETLEGDYSGALKYDMRYLALFSQTSDSSSLARALNDVGSDYRDLGEYQEAYDYLAQGYSLVKQMHKRSHQDSLILAIILHNMGSVFTQLEQFDIALGYLAASEKISEQIGDPEGPAYTYNEKGELFLKKKDFGQSEKFLKAALQEARNLKISLLIPIVHLHMADLWQARKDHQLSLLYYDSVILEQTVVNNRFGLAEAALGKGSLLMLSGKYDEALQLYQTSLNDAQHLNASNLQLECYQKLADLFEAKKDFKQSLYYLKEENSLREEIFNQGELERLIQSQIRLNLDDKDVEIAALSEARTLQADELRRQELVRNILVIVVALTVILLFSVYRSAHRRKRINDLLLQHQEDMKKRSQELEQLNEVKDKFFSIISHDLRSPMNSLGATLELLNQQNLSPAEFSELSKDLRVQFDHTRTLINNLLNWTLVQMDKLKIQPEKVVLHRKVEESFEALGYLYDKSITMENLVDTKVMAYADPNIVNLVLRNLILNAIKFTKSGGRIGVAAESKYNEVVVSVSDNGIGILPEYRESIFKKTSGYSTRGTANEKGTGLGLILCKEFVEKNGGRIWFETEVGVGTTFYFSLPKEAPRQM